ncbi:MAG: hypothetical protein JKY31_12460 [Rhodobacteraceae bacterium]|nr:hypothetical protein [Paracoccaceae bacterium]
MFGSVYNPTPGYNVYNDNNILDLKARVGYDVGPAFLYGFTGYSTAKWTNFYTEHTAAGIEYFVRDLPVDLSDGNGVIGTVSAINIRAGINF